MSPKISRKESSLDVKLPRCDNEIVSGAHHLSETGRGVALLFEWLRCRAMAE
jgi:hypothetical protein